MELFNIDLSEITKEQQLEKVKEEQQEFLRAAANNDLDNMLEEMCDTIQAYVGYMDKMGIRISDINHYWYKNHIGKMRERNFKPRNKLSKY